MAVLIVWTAFASVFAVLLGYSRVPYAAALDKNYFASFATLHKRNTSLPSPCWCWELCPFSFAYFGCLT